MIHLLVCHDGSSRDIELTERLYTLGRSPKCSIHFDAASVSRRHAYLVRVDEDVYNLEDGDLKGNRSRNGVLIKRQSTEHWQKVFSARLEHEDCIMLAENVTLQYFKSGSTPDSTGTESGTLF